MPKGLKIEGRQEHPTTRADWTAGVDHELHPQDDSDSDDSDYSSEDDESDGSDEDHDDYDDEDEIQDDPAIAGVRGGRNTNPSSET